MTVEAAVATLPILVQGNPVCGNPSQLSASHRTRRAAFPVALVSMPFISIIRPSIQLGLLKSLAVSHGFPVDTFHLNLELANEVDSDLYEAICEYGRQFIGDWLFSKEAFGTGAPDPGNKFIDHFGNQIESLCEKVAGGTEYLKSFRDQKVPQFLDRMIEQTDWGKFRVVGFTSTFQQNIASIALASRIKHAYPSVTIIFGGANFEGEMGLEYVRSISCIDYVASGEADRTFPEFLIALEAGRDPAEVPGIACLRDGAVHAPLSRPPFEQLDELPTPDYSEFFQRAEALDLLPPGPRREVTIPFESARGCWWGAKHHCTFCGLNGKSMEFRAKSPARVIEELNDAAKRYRSFRFEAVDNIMDMSYLKTFCAELIQRNTDYEFFYELKSNLTREQIKVLGDAGIRKIQPGIESLSSHVLRLMDKGVTGIQNVNTLRWSHYYGIGVGWNILYGFPGESANDYVEQNKLLAQLRHLQPPGGLGRIWMERFSPIFNDRSRFPVKNITPHASYRYIYPKNVDLQKIAYFFDYEFENSLPESEFDATRKVVADWQAAWKEIAKPALTYWSATDFLQIEDVRDPANPGTYTFEGALAYIYTALSDRPRPAGKMKEELGLPWAVEEVESALDEFCNLGLMMKEGTLYLSLALPATKGR